MNPKNVKIEHEAVRWIRKTANKMLVINKFASLKDHQAAEEPLIFFTAGSPGAGKTEFIKDFNEYVRRIVNTNPVIIDPDAVRELLPGYTGSNSYLFQRAVSIAVDDLYRHVLKNRQSAFVDGTLSDYEHAKSNLSKAIDQYNKATIFYVFQHPLVAWRFTQLREVIEGRNIQKKDFILKFIDAKTTVERVKAEFGNKVVLNVILKDYKDTKENKAVAKLFNDVHSVEECIEFNYTKVDIERILQDENS